MTSKMRTNRQTAFQLFNSRDIYGTAQSYLHFYTRGHTWRHTVFRLSNAKVSHGNLYSIRCDAAFPRDETWYLHETWHLHTMES